MWLVNKNGVFGLILMRGKTREVMTFVRKSRSVVRKTRAKRKGKVPGKREIAQMQALTQLGMGTYQVGEIMNRSPHTIRKYCQSEMFTDPKFQQMIEEYKAKELIDLTAMNISARARIHDLIPTMTPIEAVATMDKSFQQRRLLEGKSTENIFSLRKIIEDAHGGNQDAITHTRPDANEEAAKESVEEQAPQE